jgi:hypothetical protein
VIPAPIARRLTRRRASIIIDEPTPRVLRLTMENTDRREPAHDLARQPTPGRADPMRDRAHQTLAVIFHHPNCGDGG